MSPLFTGMSVTHTKFELVLNSHITILCIKASILMIQALILNSTLKYDFFLLLVGFQFQLIEMLV